MRSSWMGISFGVLPLAALVFGGCFDFTSDCAYFLCPSGSGTGGGGVQSGCDPSTSVGPVADACGVFVSVNGDDGNPGTKEQPLKTIGAALGKETAVYACAGAVPFTEAVTVSKAVTLFGALDCTTWGYDATKKTQLTAAADAVPLTLASTAGGSEVHDVAITAAGAMTAGGSSIAVIDEGASMVLDRVSVTAGAGAMGAAGAVQAQVMTPSGATGSDGTGDAVCNITAPISGGAGGKNTCNGMDTSGGLGGTGAAASAGGAGSPGNPVMTPSNAGTGQTTALQCQPGQSGTQGMNGASGIGARGIGDVSSMGYAAPIGMLGGDGTVGQGGGGGGGADACDTMNMFAGPSGGGGGAGGCPGAPGDAGQSGGSSIGILALGATLTLTTVSITTHDGGTGGIGGDGQQGGAGGLGGQPGSGNACNGGKGGQGGAGGLGGGGAGGHSVAIALQGGTAPELSTTTIVPGMGGAGGTGGNMDMTVQTKGDDGMACTTLDFTKPAGSACGM